MKIEEEIGRKAEGGTRKMSEALSIAPDKSGQAVGFNQRTEAANSFGLQPHILKMWLKPTFLYSIIRQLKLTAMKNLQLTERRISTVLNINN